MPIEHKQLIVTAEYGTYAKIIVLMAIHNQALTVTIKIFVCWHKGPTHNFAT